jgi:hypothetical protein
MTAFEDIDCRLRVEQRYPLALFSQTFRLFFLRADHAYRAPFSVRIRKPPEHML